MSDIRFDVTLEEKTTPTPSVGYTPFEDSQYFSNGDLLADGLSDATFINSANATIEGFTYNVVTDPDTFSVTGEGVFDKMMDTANKHIKAQFDAGRIRGENYADAYLALYNATLGAAIQFVLQRDLQMQQVLNAKAQRELIKNQILTEAASRASEKEKRKLYERQRKGFDDTFKSQFLKQVMDSWSIYSTVAANDETFVPPVSIISGDNVNNILKHVAKDLLIGFEDKDNDPLTPPTEEKNFWAPQLKSKDVTYSAGSTATFYMDDAVSFEKGSEIQSNEITPITAKLGSKDGSNTIEIPISPDSYTFTVPNVIVFTEEHSIKLIKAAIVSIYSA
jgi:hypothetical protein